MVIDMEGCCISLGVFLEALFSIKLTSLGPFPCFLGVLLGVLIAWMIFLSSFLDLIRMSVSIVFSHTDEL